MRTAQWVALSQVNNKLEQPSILTVSSSRSDQLFRTKAEPGLHLYIIKDKISNWVKCGGTNSGCVPERLNSVSPDQLFSLKYFALFPPHNFFNFYSLMVIEINSLRLAKFFSIITIAFLKYLVIRNLKIYSEFYVKFY